MKSRCKLTLNAIGAATALSVIFVPAAVSSGNPTNPMTDMLMVSGTCTGDVELFGKNAGRSVCKQISNTVYKNGRTGFHFVSENYIITFSGIAPQVTKSPNAAVQPVNLVIFNDTKNGDPSHPTQLRAAGTCDFANPFLGVPVVIDCEAETSRGRFTAQFRSDGSEPVIMIKEGQRMKR